MLTSIASGGSAAQLKPDPPRGSNLSPDHTTFVTAYLTAVGEGRLDELPAYLAPDVTFEGPGLTSSRGLDKFTAALQRLSPIVARNEIKRIFTDENEACVIYDFVTNTPVGAVASIEWLTIEAELITNIQLLFDKAHWPEVLHTLQKGPQTKG